MLDIFADEVALRVVDCVLSEFMYEKCPDMIPGDPLFWSEETIQKLILPYVLHCVLLREYPIAKMAAVSSTTLFWSTYKVIPCQGTLSSALRLWR